MFLTPGGAVERRLPLTAVADIRASGRRAGDGGLVVA